MRHMFCGTDSCEQKHFFQLNLAAIVSLLQALGQWRRREKTGGRKKKERRLALSFFSPRPNSFFFRPTAFSLCRPPSVPLVQSNYSVWEVKMVEYSLRVFSFVNKHNKTTTICTTLAHPLFFSQHKEHII